MWKFSEYLTLQLGQTYELSVSVQTVGTQNSNYTDPVTVRLLKEKEGGKLSVD